MIGIVLNIQTDEGLRDTVNNGKSPAGTLCHPKVLEEKEKGDVKDATRDPANGSKFATTTDNLEHFALDLPLKLRVKLVPAKAEKTAR